MELHGEWAVDDVTPRPLRISKRSLPVTRPPADVEPLAVPKQRGSKTGILSAGHTLSHPRHDDESAKNSRWSPNADRPLHKPARCSVRATSTGNLMNPNRLSNSLTRARPTSVLSSPRPRALTVALFDLEHAHCHPHQLSPQHSSQSRPSLRSRLLSRVMNGVAGRSQLSHAEMGRGASAQSPHEIPDIETEPTKHSQPARSRSGTSSSFDTAVAFGGELDLALAAFPTPPKSTATSPTTTSSLEHSRTASFAARTLLEPRKAVIPCAQINVLPENDSLGSDGRRRPVLVAIEVVGSVAPVELVPSQIPLPIIGLDVAIVIDNSLFASPGALMASCEAARFLASLLDTTTDRLTVLCTRPIKSNAKDLNVVSQLSRTSIRKIKSTVDAIVSSTDKPEPAALGMALDRAIDLLTDPVSQQVDNEPGGEAYGHVFVLTANAGGVPSILLNHEKVQVHIIRPGVIPWKGCVGTTCSGWKLAPLYSSSLQYLSLQKDQDRNSLFNRVRSLVDHARLGWSYGRLSDLVLEIETAQECSLEAVMGPQDLASLRPGEVVTTLVKVRVGEVFAKGYSLSPSPSSKSSEGSKNAKDVFDELDVMLGASPTPILIAKLSYKISLLPAGTRCSTIATAKLKLSLPQTQENMVAAHVASHGSAETRALVQKRLVYHLVTHRSPRQAIAALHESFGEDGCNSFCPQYIKLVAEELKYQARIVERFDLPSPLKGSLLPTRNTLPFEHARQGLSAMSSFKSHEWLSGVPNGASSPNSSPRNPSSNSAYELKQDHKKAENQRAAHRRPGTSMPSARQAGVPLANHRARRPPSVTKQYSSDLQPLLTGDSLDEAHTTWGDVRKMSRSSPALAELHRSESTYSQKGLLKGNWMKDLAIRSKSKPATGNVQAHGVGKGMENVAPR